jgi:hypothetical protein
VPLARGPQRALLVASRKCTIRDTVERLPAAFAGVTKVLERTGPRRPPTDDRTDRSVVMMVMMMVVVVVVMMVVAVMMVMVVMVVVSKFHVRIASFRSS